MDEWMVGWLDGWVNVWLDDWMIGWLDERMNGWLRSHPRALFVRPQSHWWARWTEWTKWTKLRALSVRPRLHILRIECGATFACGHIHQRLSTRFSRPTTSVTFIFVASLYFLPTFMPKTAGPIAFVFTLPIVPILTTALTTCCEVQHSA